MQAHRKQLEVWMLVTDEGRRRLAKLMVIQGVSQRQLADGLGMGKSHSYIGRILKGSVHTVSPDTAALIADFFGVGMDDLFVPRTSTTAARNMRRRGTAA